MKLSVNGIKINEEWEKAGIMLPGYDVEGVSAKDKRSTGMVHFGNRKYFPSVYRWYCGRTS